MLTAVTPNTSPVAKVLEGVVDDGDQVCSSVPEPTTVVGIPPALAGGVDGVDEGAVDGSP